MIRKIWLASIVMLVALAGYAQQLTIYKTFGGARFEYDTLIVSPRQVSEILSVDAPAAAEFKVARTNAAAASVLGFAGGFLIAFPLGTAIAGGDPEWGLAAVGAALILVSIPFNRAFYRRAGSAIDNYNSKHGKTGRLKPEVGWRGTGVSLRLRF